MARVAAPAPRSALLILAAALLVALVGGESEVPEFEAYRMVEYDFREQRLGSRQGKVSMGAVTPAAATAARRMVVVTFEQATVELVDQLLGEKKAGGLLIVLPSPESMASVGAASAERFRALERSLMHRHVPVPVYFAFDGPDTQKLVEQLDSGVGDAQLVAHGTVAGAKKSSVQVANMHGWLAGKGKTGEGIETLPVIAVVASFDAVAVAPELAVGANANGSGMIAILQLARMFSRLYAGSRQQGKYSLIFVLTAAGKLDYAGTRYWLEQTDSRLLDRIEFALCLDSIGLGDSIYVHTSKQPSKDKVPAVAKLFGTLKSAAQEMLPALPLEIVRKKINVSDAVAWEHEQFSRKDILAVTLSGHATHDPALRASVLDRTVDSEVLSRNILFVANSIAKVVYELDAPEDIFNGTLGPQRKFIEAWAYQLAREPRMAALLGEGALNLVGKAETILRDASSESQRQPFTLGPERTFYSQNYKVRMSVYETRPLMFDLIMSAGVAAYLFTMLVAMLGPGEAVKALVELTKSNAKKAKSR
eukprot:Tamp_06643.p1 GENE.Tamp_06643~~Tamp_06643.p1  ORF type:complete len:555 (-),score=160.79 Tamp_06643:1000-2604(-)